MVVNIDPQKGLLVKLPFGGMGTVAITDLADAYRPNPLGGYSKNQILRLVFLTLIKRYTFSKYISKHSLDVCFKSVFFASGFSFLGITMASGSCLYVHRGLRRLLV